MEPNEFQGKEVYASKVYVKALCEALERMHDWQQDAEEMFHAANEDEQRELRIDAMRLSEPKNLYSWFSKQSKMTWSTQSEVAM
jgi:ribosomal protein S12 methylthiotransferase accessory factor YcaO